jgi:predicted regulator of Ras-like GTPase activity (Roadblock/LC7/MglB family)
MTVRRSRQAKTEKILRSLVKDGTFLSAIVASSDGLPVAMVGKANTLMIAAVAASMKDLAERALEGLTEISTRDESGHRIVSRYFSIDGDLLLLAVELPKNCAYRRLTNQAIKSIKSIWANQAIEV